jgi:hypothetical protein
MYETAASKNVMVDCTTGQRCLRGSVYSEALNRHAERVFDSSRTETHWGKRKLAGSVTHVPHDKYLRRPFATLCSCLL